MDDSKGKLGENSWMESGETWGKDRSTQDTTNPWIKINKTSSNEQITKKLGAIFVVIFEIGEEHNKIRLENEEGRLRNRDQRGS